MGSHLGDLQINDLELKDVFRKIFVLSATYNVANLIYRSYSFL